MIPEVSGPVEPAVRDHGHAVVTEPVERDQLGPPGAYEVLAQPLVGVVGLRVVEGADERVEDLTDRERQVVLVRGEDLLYLLEQRSRLGLRGPVGVASRASTTVFTARRELDRAHAAALNRAASVAAAPSLRHGPRARSRHHASSCSPSKR